MDVGGRRRTVEKVCSNINKMRHSSFSIRRSIVLCSSQSLISFRLLRLNMRVAIKFDAITGYLFGIFLVVSKRILRFETNEMLSIYLVWFCFLEKHWAFTLVHALGCLARALRICLAFILLYYSVLLRFTHILNADAMCWCGNSSGGKFSGWHFGRQKPTIQPTFRNREMKTINVECI